MIFPPAKRIHNCKYCKESSGLIYPEDLGKAQRMPDGSLKCYTCQTIDLHKQMIASMGHTALPYKKNPYLRLKK